MEIDTDTQNMQMVGATTAAAAEVINATAVSDAPAQPVSDYDVAMTTESLNHLRAKGTLATLMPGLARACAGGPLTHEQVRSLLNSGELEAMLPPTSQLNDDVIRELQASGELKPLHQGAVPPPFFYQMLNPYRHGCPKYGTPASVLRKKHQDLIYDFFLYQKPNKEYALRVESSMMMQKMADEIINTWGTPEVNYEFISTQIRLRLDLNKFITQ